MASSCKNRNVTAGTMRMKSKMASACNCRKSRWPHFQQEESCVTACALRTKVHRRVRAYVRVCMRAFSAFLVAYVLQIACGGGARACEHICYHANMFVTMRTCSFVEAPTSGVTAGYLECLMGSIMLQTACILYCPGDNRSNVCTSVLNMNSRH